MHADCSRCVGTKAEGGDKSCPPSASQELALAVMRYSPVPESATSSGLNLPT